MSLGGPLAVVSCCGLLLAFSGYALLSLTAIRMIPVALSLARSGLANLLPGLVRTPRPRVDRLTGLLVEAELPSSEPIVHVVMLTVGLSVLLHGITAGAGANRYADWYLTDIAFAPLSQMRPGTIALCGLMLA